MKVETPIPWELLQRQYLLKRVTDCLVSIHRYHLIHLTVISGLKVQRSLSLIMMIPQGIHGAFLLITMEVVVIIRL